MARLIDADALKELEEMEYIYFTSPAAVPFYEADKVWDAIKNTPTADVVEVKHGRWIDYLVRDWRCSECGEKIHKVRQVDGYCYDDMPNYCPNCGAKMDGK